MELRVHSVNLHANSDIFPNGAFTKDEIVDLTEDGDTLELLFQFMYRQPRPILRSLSIHRVLALAEAAEKYVVYNAKDVCVEHLEFVLKHTLHLNEAA